MNIYTYELFPGCAKIMLELDNDGINYRYIQAILWPNSESESSESAECSHIYVNSYLYCELDDSYLVAGFRAMLAHIRDNYPQVHRVKIREMMPTNQIIMCRSIGNPESMSFFSLSYSLAFYGKSWHERHASELNINIEIDPEIRDRIHQVLYNPNVKPAKYVDFIRIICMAGPSDMEELMRVLEPYYENTRTYSEFFAAIPVDKRFSYVGEWVYEFMKHYGIEKFEQIITITKGGVETQCLVHRGVSPPEWAESVGSLSRFP